MVTKGVGGDMYQEPEAGRAKQVVGATQATQIREEEFYTLIELQATQLFTERNVDITFTLKIKILLLRRRKVDINI